MEKKYICKKCNRGFISSYPTNYCNKCKNEYNTKAKMRNNNSNYAEKILKLRILTEMKNGK